MPRAKKEEKEKAKEVEVAAENYADYTDYLKAKKENNNNKGGE